MLTVIGAAIQGRVPDVTTPRAFERLSSRRVLTMSFVEGEPLGDIIQRALRGSAGGPPGSPISSSPGYHERAAAGMQPKGGVSVDGNALVARLVESYGTQIFGIGRFHSDPHPGNVLVGEDGKTLSVIDFGQTKELRDETRLGICRLILALAADRAEETARYAAALGLEISGASKEFAMTVCYILFDTRMDLIEAHLSPLDAVVPPEMRLVKLETIPEDIFMLIRVVALIRGMLISLNALDVNARLIWRPYAMAALRAAGERVPGWALDHEAAVDEAAETKSPKTPKTPNAGAGASADPKSGAVYGKMKALAGWMRANDLPHNRKALTPFVATGLLTVEHVAAAIEREEEDKLARAFLMFSPEDAKRCRAIAMRVAAGAAARMDAEEAAGKEGAERGENDAEKRLRERAEAKAREARDKKQKGKGNISSEGADARDVDVDVSVVSMNILTSMLRWSWRAKRYVVAAAKAEAARLEAEKKRAANIAKREVEEKAVLEAAAEKAREEAAKKKKAEEEAAAAKKKAAEEEAAAAAKKKKAAEEEAAAAKKKKRRKTSRRRREEEEGGGRGSRRRREKKAAEEEAAAAKKKKAEEEAAAAAKKKAAEEEAAAEGEEEEGGRSRRRRRRRRGKDEGGRRGSRSRAAWRAAGRSGFGTRGVEGTGD